MLLTCSKIKAGVRDTGSFKTACNVIILVPPRKFSNILISRLIFFFFTGCNLNILFTLADNILSILVRTSKRAYQYYINEIRINKRKFT